MWDTLVVPLIVGITVLYGGHLLTRDTRRSRALSIARQELETAELLDCNSDLATRLRDSANLGIDRYLDPRGLETVEGKTRLASKIVATAVTLVGLAMVVARTDGDDPRVLENVVLGAALGAAWLVVDAATNAATRRIWGSGTQ